MEDIRLLASATDFFIARIKKLERKEKQGYAGWEDFGWKSADEIKTRAKMKLTQRNLINISNFCQFLWQILEDEKEEKHEKG